MVGRSLWPNEYIVALILVKLTGKVGHDSSEQETKYCLQAIYKLTM